MNSNQHDEFYMTLCLAGLYDNRAHAVIVADKLITHKFHGAVDDFSVDCEDITKIFKMNDTTAILFSGNRTFGYRLVEMIEKRLKRMRDVEKTKLVVRRAYDDLEAERAFRQQIYPTFTTLQQYRRYNLDAVVRKEYDLRLRNYKLDLDVLLVGKEGAKYKIYVLEEGIMSYKPEGYAGIGTGSNFAASTLGKNYSPFMSQSEALSVMDAAKKVAEQTELVGKQTDIEYLS